jgi:diketogulonate reductase-like aldo/keto reductase
VATDKNIILNNGVPLPPIGLGTALANNDELVEAIKYAVSIGYRLIDTAATYANSQSVGRAVAKCGIPRKDLFVTSKLGNNDHGYSETLAAFDKTLNFLGLDYLDCYLIHWPNPIKTREQGYEKQNAETWAAMEEIYKSGRAKSIGVSNFYIHHLEALLKTAKIKPAINQICLHPGSPHTDIVEFCRANDICLQAYSPLGAGRVLESDEIAEIAKKYNKTPAQICLRWGIQNSFSPIPKSIKQNRISENFDVFDFSLNDDDMQTLSAMPDYNNVKLPHPDFAEF